MWSTKREKDHLFSLWSILRTPWAFDIIMMFMKRFPTCYLNSTLIVKIIYLLEQYYPIIKHLNSAEIRDAQRLKPKNWDSIKIKWDILI